jgi:amidohydrolase
LDRDLRNSIAGLIEEIIAGIVHSMGGEYEFNFKYLYPPTINDTTITDLLVHSTSKVIGQENVLWAEDPSMGGEDFAFFAEKAPSTFFRLGCGNVAKGLVYPIHNARFDVDEDCITIGASVFAQFAVDYLSE